MSLPYKPCWYFVLRSSLAGAVTAAMVPAVFAQERTLCGIVQDQTRAVVASAAVELTNAGTRVKSKTGSEGKFCFAHGKPGRYELTVQANGFRTDREKFSVHSAEPANLTISLSVEAANQQ